MNTGHSDIDAVLESVVASCIAEISQLLAARDAALSRVPTRGVLANRKLEMLSEVDVDLDRKLAAD